MKPISHAEQHQKFPAGTVVFALDGERLGTVRDVYDHFFRVKQDGDDLGDLEVPPHAVASFDGEKIQLSVNRRALTIVDDTESALRRYQQENR
jgi:hypothetical protein